MSGTTVGTSGEMSGTTGGTSGLTGARTAGTTHQTGKLPPPPPPGVPPRVVLPAAASACVSPPFPRPRLPFLHLAQTCLCCSPPLITRATLAAPRRRPERREERRGAGRDEGKPSAKGGRTVDPNDPEIAAANAERAKLGLPPLK